MKVLFDTNVVLDVMLGRQPHVAAGAVVMGLAESGRIGGVLAATSVTTIHYLLRKSLGTRPARRHLETVLAVFDVAPVDARALRHALALGFADYEDAVIHEAARAARCRGIVTRDPAGFRKGSLPAWSPQELLAAL